MFDTGFSCDFMNMEVFRSSRAIPILLDERPQEIVLTPRIFHRCRVEVVVGDIRDDSASIGQ